MFRIREAVTTAAGRLSQAAVESPRLEAEILLSKATGWPRQVILIHDDKPVPEVAMVKFDELVTRRCRREPLQQILGEAEFFGLKIVVDENVMAPRPETEVLVEQVIVRWRSGHRKILDIGTGSGCIAVALAMNLPECSVDAVDISDKALEVAGRNVALYGLEDRIKIVNSDLFPSGDQSYDLIVSNPPYIRTAEIAGLMPEVSRYEPHLALDGGDDGLEFYRKIAEIAPSRLSSNGLLFLEVGAGQAEEVGSMMSEAFGHSTMSKVKDLCGIERVLVVGKRC